MPFILPKITRRRLPISSTLPSFLSTTCLLQDLRPSGAYFTCADHLASRDGPLSRLPLSDLSLLLIVYDTERVNNDYKAVTYDTVSPTQCIKDLYISLLVSHRHFYSHSASINVYLNKYIYLSTKIFELFACLVKNAEVINSFPLESENSCHLYCTLMIQLPSFIE